MKIPETANPWRAIVNGVEKEYEAGATVTDDASVKEIIEKGNAFPPEPAPVPTPFPIPEQESGGGVVTANVTYSSYNYSADVSYADLRAAYEAGKEIQLLYSNDVYKLSGVRSNELIFSLMVVSNGSSATQKTFTYSSSSLLSNNPSIEITSGCYESDATEDSGTYTLGDTAGNLYEYIIGLTPVTIYIEIGSAVHYCPVVDMKVVESGDDASYSFYIVLNGNVVSFTAATSDDYPTYTPST